MHKEIVCISCPMGCRLSVTGSVDDLHIEGNHCKRGLIYGKEEILSPKRVVTATVALKGGGEVSRVPVKTTQPVPKKFISGLLDTLYTMEVSTPIAGGTVILEDYLNTGVSVITTRSFNNSV